MMFSMVVSVIGIIVVAFYFALPSMVRLPTFRVDVMYGHVGLLLPLEIGRFSFNLILLSKSKSHDMVGVKNIIRIGSYIIGSVLAAVCVVTIVTKSVLISNGQVHHNEAIFSIVFESFILIFAVCLLIGIKTVGAKKIRAWIIINFLLFSIIIVALIILLQVTGSNPLRIGQIMFLCFNFLYVLGIMTIHYNIILNANLSPRSIKNTTNDDIENNSTPANAVNMWTTFKEEKIGFSNPTMENATIL
jgi:hypothetical protein